MNSFKLLIVSVVVGSSIIGVSARPNSGGEVLEQGSGSLEEKDLSFGENQRQGQGGLEDVPLVANAGSSAETYKELGELGGLESKETSVGEKSETDASKISEWSKLIFNPIELIKSICRHFNIPIEKFIDRVSHVFISGIELLLQPALVSAKLVEKVFVPDHCRLNFICSIGKRLDFVRSKVVQFSPNFLQGSRHLGALAEGIVGHDCSTLFTECEPKLSKEFEDLRVNK